MVEHIVTASTPDGIWLIGTVDSCYFYTKVCDETSGFGVDGGRIVKLYGHKANGKEIFSYERGWDKFPSKNYKGLVQALVRFAESLPAQDVWRETFKLSRRFFITEDEVREDKDF